MAIASSNFPAGSLWDEKLATLVAGQRAVDLTWQQAVVCDVASALVGGGVLPELRLRIFLATTSGNRS